MKKIPVVKIFHILVWTAVLWCGIIPNGAQATSIAPNIAFKDIPPEIIKAGNDYIVAIVGESYFKNKFKLSEHSVGYRFKEGSARYTLLYQAPPLDKMQKEKRTISLDIDQDKQVRTSDIIAIIKDGQVTTITVNQEQAISIAKKKLQALNQQTMVLQDARIASYPENKTYVWNIALGPAAYGMQCMTEHCCESYITKIDVFTGEATSIEKVCVSAPPPPPTPPIPN